MTSVAAAGPNQHVADAAVRIAAEGGNAVDAAVAAGLVAMVTEPGIVALGGAAFITVAPAGGPAVTIDGNVEMPGRSVPAQSRYDGYRLVHLDYGGGVECGVGYGSVATAGTPAALGLAHRRYGALPWRVVCEPAIDAAAQGFPLGSASASYLGLVHEVVYGWHPESHALVHAPGGLRPLGLGETMVQPALAGALRRLADAGAQDLYTGDLAAALVADMERSGGLVRADDLAAYSPAVRPALAVRMGDWEFDTNPAPAIGGPVLAAMLMLTGAASSSSSAGPSPRERIAVQESVLRHRVQVLDVAEDRLAEAEKMLEGIAEQGFSWLRGSASTIHVSAVDGDGLACALTASCGYGSGAMISGTGIWLNNALGEPELNRRGTFAWAPGTRLPSNMAPTVGRHPDGSVLAIGSPGADRITTAIAQVLGHLANGHDLADAVAAPRVHVHTDRAGAVLVEYEPGPDLDGVELPTHAWPALNMYFGGVGAALLAPGGRLRAAADPRRDGGTAVI